jgi:hypothetical protein
VGNLRQSGAADRFEYDSVRPHVCSGLNGLEDLGALSYRAILRKQYFSLDTELARGLIRGTRLFDLVIVIMCG